MRGGGARSAVARGATLLCVLASALLTDGANVVQAAGPTVSWTTRAPVPGVRDFETPLLVPGQRLVYLLGGWRDPSIDPGPDPRFVDVYDPDADRWCCRRPVDLWPMQAPTGWVGSRMSGLIYGLVDGGGDLSTSTMHLYELDPSSGEWRKRRGPVALRHFPKLAGGQDGRIFAVGTEIWQDGATDTDRFDGVQEYDPVDNEWRARQSMPLARSDAVVVQASSGKVYVFGGRSWTTYGPIDQIDEYDPASGTWTTRPERFAISSDLGQAVAAPDGRIYLWDSYSSPTRPPLSVFDPVLGGIQVVTSADGNWPTRELARLGIGPDGELIAVGGEPRTRSPPSMSAARGVVTGLAPHPPATATPVRLSTATATPTPSPTPRPPTASRTPTARPSSTATGTPTARPTSTPTRTTTVRPTVPPGRTASPTRTPTPTRTRTPTRVPSATPTPTAIGAVSSQPPRVVSIFGSRPSAKLLTIRPGTTVTWRNGDRWEHQVVVDGLLDSGPLRARTQTTPGGTFTYTFTEPGTYSYYSPLDRRVTGIVRVR